VGSERRVLLRLRRRHHHRLLLRLRRGHELRRLRLVVVLEGVEVVVGLRGQRHRAVRTAVLLREVVVHRSSPTCGREGGSDLTSPGRCGHGGGGMEGEKRRIAARRCELGQGALCVNSDGPPRPRGVVFFLLRFSFSSSSDSGDPAPILLLLARPGLHPSGSAHRPTAAEAPPPPPVSHHPPEASIVDRVRRRRRPQATLTSTIGTAATAGDNLPPGAPPRARPRLRHHSRSPGSSSSPQRS
jgi:hypothetical protein